MLLTRFRTGAAAIVAVAIIALMALAPGLASPASAATQTVSVGSPTNRFTPNVSTIHVGDTVTFNWSAGTHTVVFPSGASADLSITSGNPSGVTTAFSTPGTYYYFCSIHAEATDATEAHVQANDAMVGKVVVLAAGATTPTTAPSTPTAATTPVATTPPTTASNGQCVLTVKDEAVAGTKTIIIPKSTQARAGYIAIHESSATGAPGTVIGVTAYQPAGTVYTNLAVGLDRVLKDGEVIWPMLHTEDNGNTTYDGAAVDLPTVDAACGNSAAGNIVTFTMKISAAAAGAPAAPGTGTGVQSDSSNEWTFALLGGVLAVLLISGGTVVAVRRHTRD
jgi:plastocyanin